MTSLQLKYSEMNKENISSEYDNYLFCKSCPDKSSDLRLPGAPLIASSLPTNLPNYITDDTREFDGSKSSSKVTISPHYFFL